ncbi:hypothetical protein BDV96DRAFT_608277 [Lophiotrema nucula]|uniref:C2H2-type domain-containing protein n=1 Tax=Lophiotrema nucula TaxID=690887 RepID=A0A6A5YGV0_9PLEO|nr:hypothetical protein BDV96DRAFT_608277 [Lophiotrema nucula]
MSSETEVDGSHAFRVAGSEWVGHNGTLEHPVDQNEVDGTLFKMEGVRPNHSASDAAPKFRDWSSYRVECEDCEAKFTGPYADGNLTRHLKTCAGREDSISQVYICGVVNCSKTYKRSDALLNHMRRKHGAPPAKRKSSRPSIVVSNV